VSEGLQISFLLFLEHIMLLMGHLLLEDQCQAFESRAHYIIECIAILHHSSTT
jgi:hypothetical protein